MAGRLAFQTQLASIMEVLANAAVAEICKLVDDDYAVVSLQMSQCQRENKALKRKLHLMELKMARAAAERRLRDGAVGGGRAARAHGGGSTDRFRSSSSSSSATSGVVFEGQMDMGSWAGGAAPGTTGREQTTCDLRQDTSADVELVEAELVKQEKMEETEEEVQEEVQLIRADGQLERGSAGGRVQRSSRPQQEVQAAYRLNECPDPVPSASTRGVEAAGWQKEEEPDMMLVKQEAGLETPDHAHPTFIIQEGSAGLPLDDTDRAASQPVQELQECGRGFSETPADPQAKPSEEPCATISVHTGAPDTNTPAKDSTSHQPRRAGGEALASECSVLDLEAFFTRWTPDSGAPPAAPPSCSFSTEELLEEEEEEVVLVEEDHRPPCRRGGAASSQRSSTIHTNHSPSPGTSLSASPRIQAPPPQLTWSRAAAMMRTAQTQSPQHSRHGDRTAHRVLHSPQNPLTTTANAALSDVSHVAGTRIRRLANFPGFPPGAGLPARGSEGKGLGGVSIGLDGVSMGLDSVSMGLGGVSSRLGGVSGGLDGVSVGLGSGKGGLGGVSMGLGGVTSRLGGVSSGLGGVTSGLGGVSMGLGGVSAGLGGVSSRLGSVSGGLGGVSGGLGGVSRGLGGVTGGLGGVSGGLGGVSRVLGSGSGGLGGGSRRRNYACRACGKAFSGLSNLEAHQRVHTGEKPFGCSTCGKRFSEAGNLKKHQRVHTGDKPYSCQRCGKRFAWVCSLKTHQQTGCGLQGRGPGGSGGPDQ